MAHDRRAYGRPDRHLLMYIESLTAVLAAAKATSP